MGRDISGARCTLMVFYYFSAFCFSLLLCVPGTYISFYPVCVCVFVVVRFSIFIASSLRSRRANVNTQGKNRWVTKHILLKLRRDRRRRRRVCVCTHWLWCFDLVLFVRRYVDGNEIKNVNASTGRTNERGLTLTRSHFVIFVEKGRLNKCDKKTSENDVGE